MEDEILGLITGVECKFVKTDPLLIEELAKEKNLSEGMVKIWMRYNIFTVKQFSDLSGLTVGAVTNLTRPSLNGTQVVAPKINFCYPFPDHDGNGPKYIFRNEASEKYFKG